MTSPNEAADLTPRDVERPSKRRKRRLVLRDEPEQTTALRGVGQVRDVDPKSHARAAWSKVATVSSRNKGTTRTKSGDDREVAEHRSEKYRKPIKLAGMAIKLARERKEWSQAELAKRAGLNKSDISRLENGKHLEISVGRFFDICHALSLDPLEVWTGERRRGGHHGDKSERPSDSSVDSEIRPSSRPRVR